MDFVKLAPLMIPSVKPIGDVIDCRGPAYDRFLQPLLLAALNTDPHGRLGRARRRDHPRDALPAAGAPAGR